MQICGNGFFNANAGILNKVLLKLHLIDENIVWLGSGKLAINMIILSDTWKMLPLVIIMLLAGLRPCLMMQRRHQL